MTEIRETAANQNELVKEALDWREHFKKRPLAWSLGALGVGFFAGYGIAAAIKGEERGELEYAPSVTHAYAAQPILGEHQPSEAANAGIATNGDKHKGAGLVGRFRKTSVYDRLSKEVASLGDRLIDELSTTAQQVVLPALLTKIKDWIGLDLSEERQEQSVSSTPQASSVQDSTFSERSS